MKLLKNKTTKAGLVGLLLAAITAGSILYLRGRREKVIIVPPNAQVGDLALEHCTIEVESVAYDADCGTIIVRENRQKADSRLIALPITRFRATSDNPAEPIFFLNGGPGNSNMNIKPFASILANHDFVLVGYRGVDGSAVLDCPEITQAVKGDGEDVLGAQSLAGMSAAMRQCAARLQAEGVDLDGYTIQEVIGDMEAVRAELGYEQINLFSASYGTRVAQLYAYQHPTRIKRSAMMGVNPHGRFVWEPDMVDAQIEQYAQLYAQTENPRTADLAETMRNVSHNMPKRWLFFKIDPGKVKGVTFALLFHKGTAAMAFDSWIAAEEGDPSGLALMSLAYNFVLPNLSVYGEFFAKAISVDYDPSRDYSAEMDPPDSIIGAPLSKLFWGSTTDEAGPTWPTEPMAADLRQVNRSDVETLLISGNIDFSTPAEFATDELLPTLGNGTQVILTEMGHGNDTMTLQPEAMHHLLTTFFDSGEVDDSKFVYDRADFQVTWGFPLLAKVGLGTVLALSAAIIWLGWFVWRRLLKN